MAHEFQAWPKTARLFRDVVVTEKIDGTNAGIHISAVSDYADGFLNYPPESYSLVVDGTRYVVTAQSRKRLITPGKTTDNYGFAGWVYDNAEALVRTLGEGLHFGEWWGQGIQRGYGMSCRHFSLFNAERYAGMFAMVGDSMVQPVPVLYRGPFSEAKVWDLVDDLKTNGSTAVRGWASPEGVCVFHVASGRVFKVTTDHQDGNPQHLASGPLNDVPRRDLGKWEA